MLEVAGGCWSWRRTFLEVAGVCWRVRWRLMEDSSVWRTQSCILSAACRYVLALPEGVQEPSDEKADSPTKEPEAEESSVGSALPDFSDAMKTIRFRVPTKASAEVCSAVPVMHEKLPCPHCGPTRCIRDMRQGKGWRTRRRWERRAAMGGIRASSPRRRMRTVSP